MSLHLNKKEIQKNLKTELIGRKIILFDELKSTNSEAARLAQQGEEEGTIIIADTQTEGRGRLGRYWLSPKGTGIYLSIILRPTISPQDSLFIVFLTAVAAVESIRTETSLPAMIKWPNDILIDHKKTGGILIEMRTGKQKIDYLVNGIGINVNTDTSAFPKTIHEKSTSLKKALGKEIDRNRLIKVFLELFEKWYLTFTTKGKKEIREKWLEYTDIIGKEIDAEISKRPVRGTVINIDEYGSLLLQTNGKIEKTTGGDIALMNKE